MLRFPYDREEIDRLKAELPTRWPDPEILPMPDLVLDEMNGRLRKSKKLSEGAMRNMMPKKRGRPKKNG